MSVIFSAILIIMCVIACSYALRKIKKSQLRIEDAFFWILISFGLLILSIFPSIAVFFTHIIGMEAPSNFIFLVMIFLLLVKVFSLSIRVSQMDEKIKNLVQKIAIINNENDKKFDEIDRNNK